MWTELTFISAYWTTVKASAGTLHVIFSSLIKRKMQKVGNGDALPGEEIDGDLQEQGRIVW